MPRPIFAEIDLCAMRHNLAVAKRLAGTRHILAVVKANAYGHGLARVLPALSDADGLALLDLEEARWARECGWPKPIVLLEGFFEPDDLNTIFDLDLMPVIHHRAQVEWLEKYAPGPRGPLRVTVKINTGMNRLGFAPEQLQGVLHRLQAIGSVYVTTLMTHFANGDVRDTQHPMGVDEQLQRFAAAAQGWHGLVSLANSAALLVHPQVQGNVIRPGIMLYGATPMSGEPAAGFGLRPVMRLRTQLIAVQSLTAGQAVGYGSRWVAPRDTRVGIVACGYADGYPRIAPDGTPVWVDGVLVPTAGRVSMDMMVVDLTQAPHARVGSPVELWGDHVPIDTVAERAGTVGYELMCALAARVPVRTLA